MNEQRSINLGQALENGGISGEVLAHLNKGADDINTHGDRARDVEDIGGHEGAVFGKGNRRIAPTAPHSAWVS